ncbi:TPA: restriction endonuclease subunit S [Klebsiella michiganensis]|nr:restriction endonuclease subunit S [Klebsiella michiganensis]
MRGGKLPEGWVQAVLGDYLYLKNGFAFKSTEYVTPGAHSFPVIRISDLDGTCATDSSAVHILQGVEGFTIEKGDLLIAMSGATTGKIGIYAGNIPAYQNQRVGNIKLRSSTYGDEKYRNYLITSVSKRILDEAYGGAQPNISGKSIEALPFHLAPLAEQKIIAERLDTLLTQVDSTKARLEQIPQILKRFRQAVLSAAVGGKFTTDTGFIQSPLTIGLETSFSPKGWQWYKLTELAQLESGHTPRKTISEYWDNGDIPWISLQDIRAAHGKVIYKTKFMPTQKGIDNSSARLLPEGTVCFSRDISVGYTTIMGTSMATTQHFANWICGKKLNNKYLMFSFMAAKQHLTKSGQGTTVKTIYMPALKELQILIPPLPEQQEIVRRVEQLFAYADTIEKQVNSALTRVNSLTQSILAKAFRGELTAQWRAENPDLISDENSAAALLEKIKAERTASGSKKTTRKKA